MTKIGLLESVRNNLNNNTGSWPQIARESGVAYHTLTKIASGVIKDPGVSKVQALADYFESKSEGEVESQQPDQAA